MQILNKIQNIEQNINIHENNQNMIIYLIESQFKECCYKIENFDVKTILIYIIYKHHHFYFNSYQYCYFILD